MNKSTQPLTLQDVKQKFDDWRSKRGKQGSFPEEHWRAAVDLLGRYDSVEITRELRITKQQLEDRKHRYQPTNINNNSFVGFEVTNNTANDCIDNVKLTQQGASPSSTSSIELRRPDGTILIIHELQQTQIHSLITAFIG